MYTEISHFLLLYAILNAIYFFILYFLQKIINFLFSKGNTQQTLYGPPCEQRGILSCKQAVLFDCRQGAHSDCKQGDLLGPRGHFHLLDLLNCKQTLIPSEPLASASLRLDLLIFLALFITLTFCLFGTINNYVCSDFSVYNTLTNSTADVPLFYKISATWSNHEGSLLLWCWLLSVNIFFFHVICCSREFLVFSRISSILNQTKSDNTLQNFFKINFKPFQISTLLGKTSTKKTHSQSIYVSRRHSKLNSFQNSRNRNQSGFVLEDRHLQKKNKKKNTNLFDEKNKSWIGLFRCTNFKNPFLKNQQYFQAGTIRTATVLLFFFTVFCIFTSNPFLRTSISTIISLAELNPILQDPILAIHPPCIYAGYVASAVAFSISISLLLGATPQKELYNQSI